MAERRFHLARLLLAVALKHKVIGKGLQSGAFPDGEAAVLFGVRESSSREAIESCGQGNGRLVPRETAINVHMPMSPIVFVAV